MPTNITDVDNFDAVISVPVDGDLRNAGSLSPAFQSLANRTRNHKNRLDGLDTDVSALGAQITAVEAKRHGAQYWVSGTSIADLSKFTLTLVRRSNDSYTVSTNEIQVPEAGWYRVFASLRVQIADATNPSTGAARIRFNQGSPQTLLTIAADRFSTNVNHWVTFAGESLVQIATPSSERIWIEAFANTTTSAGSGASVLVVQRIA